MWIQRSNLPVEMATPSSTKGPNLMKNDESSGHLLIHTSYILFIPGRTSDWALDFLPCVCFFCCLSLSINGLRPALSNQNCTIWMLHLHKIDLIENVSRNICYNRWPLLCLSETLLNCYLKLSPGYPAPFAQIKAYYFYYNLNLTLVYTKQI